MQIKIFGTHIKIIKNFLMFCVNCLYLVLFTVIVLEVINFCFITKEIRYYISCLYFSVQGKDLFQV